MSGEKSSVTAIIKSDSARVAKLKRKLVKCIPRFPNNKASLAHMQKKGLGELLIDYCNWRARYVGIRPRSVIIPTELYNAKSWVSSASAINAFLKSVEEGDDLTPNLSLKPHTKGYALNARRKRATSEEKWSDKDFLLAMMGYHHFHLGDIDLIHRHAGRTNELIFAKVDRDQFAVVDIFDHSVFEMGSAENTRLCEIHDQVVSTNREPNAVYVGAAVATSGHSLHVVSYAAQCCKTVNAYEAKLDNRDFANSLFHDAGLKPPLKPNFEWQITHLDFSICERTTNTNFIFHQGWN